MRRNETPGRIVTNFCTGVGVHDVITSANFYDCRLWGLSAVGGQILGFSIDLRRRPYNTLALPCECVIVNFQLRSSIHARLTERSLYNWFALKNRPKWGFWEILGGGAKIFGENFLGMQRPPIYVVW